MVSLFSGKACFSPSVHRQLLKSWVKYGGTLVLSKEDFWKAEFFFCDGIDDPWLGPLLSRSLVVIHAAWVYESAAERFVMPIAKYILDDHFCPFDVDPGYIQPLKYANPISRRPRHRPKSSSPKSSAQTIAPPHEPRLHNSINLQVSDSDPGRQPLKRTHLSERKDVADDSKTCSSDGLAFKIVPSRRNVLVPAFHRLHLKHAFPVDSKHLPDTSCPLLPLAVQKLRQPRFAETCRPAAIVLDDHTSTRSSISEFRTANSSSDTTLVSNSPRSGLALSSLYNMSTSAASDPRIPGTSTEPPFSTTSSLSICALKAVPDPNTNQMSNRYSDTNTRPLSDGNRRWYTVRQECHPPLATIKRQVEAEGDKVRYYDCHAPVSPPRPDALETYWTRTQASHKSGSHPFRVSIASMLSSSTPNEGSALFVPGGRCRGKVFRVVGHT